MANRTRNIVLRVPVTAEERALIEKKMQLREYDAVNQNVDSILSPAQLREQEKTL